MRARSLHLVVFTCASVLLLACGSSSSDSNANAGAGASAGGRSNVGSAGAPAGGASGAISSSTAGAAGANTSSSGGSTNGGAGGASAGAGGSLAGSANSAGAAGGAGRSSGGASGASAGAGGSTGGTNTSGGANTSGGSSGSTNGGSGGSGGSSTTSEFVTVCGTSLCLKGNNFRVKGATAYGMYDDPNGEVAAAVGANLNVLEIVEFETQFHTLSDTMSTATWTRVDKLVAAAKTAGLHVVFNLSSYGQALEAAGQTATAVDWKPYLQFIAQRVNTVNHVVYAQDPTIAMIELFGEIPQPTGQGTNGTPQQMTNFYHQALTELAQLFPNTLRSSGGFSYLDEPNAANIDWKTIMNDPADQVCAVEINAAGDRNTSVPMVSSYCKSIGKPWFLAAWSSCVPNQPSFTGDLDSQPTDADGAAHATDMYQVAADKNVSGTAPAMAAIGSDFWNLASGNSACNINNTNSLITQTYAVIKAAQ